MAREGRLLLLAIRQRVHRLLLALEDPVGVMRHRRVEVHPEQVGHGHDADAHHAQVGGRRMAKDVRENVLVQAGICHDGLPAEPHMRLVRRTVRVVDGMLASAQFSCAEAAPSNGSKGPKLPAVRPGEMRHKLALGGCREADATGPDFGTHLGTRDGRCGFYAQGGAWCDQTLEDADSRDRADPSILDEADLQWVVCTPSLRWRHRRFVSIVKPTLKST